MLKEEILIDSLRKIEQAIDRIIKNLLVWIAIIIIIIRHPGWNVWKVLVCY